MVRTLATVELGERANQVIRATRETGEPILIEENGETVMVMISPTEYERYLRAEVERDWAVIQRVKALNADKDPEDILQAVTDVVERVRQERYDREQASTGNSR